MIKLSKIIRRKLFMTYNYILTLKIIEGHFDVQEKTKRLVSAFYTLLNLLFCLPILSISKFDF